ncbi:hypothetical protein HELRODRAFT_85245, partial [Helobdella robusta]|uniref:Carboxylesterase type B domain-containing protein n=1 Tax=Helobdella robusta TaxID=6412 RepID=T1G5U6_HELRO
IPFAQPPVGDLRFEAPQPVQKWSGVLNAKEKKPSCVQVMMMTRVMMKNEDCLYLNIFTPYKSDATKKYPVLFYIHGGSYRSGSGHIYNGKVVSMMGVVVVTINYRLDVFGFLTAADNILPGNYGLRDVVMALNWVHDNIASFRGDASRITLVGHSVGSALVGILMTLPSTRGLSFF